MPMLTVDGIKVIVPDGALVLQAREHAGTEAPPFCYYQARLGGKASYHAVVAE